MWEPNETYIGRANVTRFMKVHGIEDHRELVARSQTDIEWFWDAVVKDLGIEFFTPYERVLDDSGGAPWPRWFVGGSINLVHNCVDRHALSRPGSHALLWESEDGSVSRLTYTEMSARVDGVARGLLTFGVERGDVVAVCMPMIPEAAVALYAIAKIGAIYLPIFSGFGPPAIATRLNDSKAKVLLTADGFLRRGAVVEMKTTVDQAVADSPAIRRVVVFRRFPDRPVDLGHRDVDWSEAFPDVPGAAPTPALDPETPFMIAYTSGTTGRPKGAVHVHGGFLVKVAEEVAYHADVSAEDVLHWATDMGWIMGPWEMVGAHAAGASVLMYEGAPNHPGHDRLWALAERHRVSVLGVSPTLIRALIPAGEEVVRSHDLSSLRVLASTGEPWNPEPYRWFSEVVGRGRLPIVNISGGTEVGACFLGQTPAIPTKSCSLGTPMLGMAIDVYDDEGRSLRGEVGELVCTKPWPSQTRGFWGAPERYLQTYWSRWADVWVHGDWASVDDEGYWFLHGRSDDTMNVAGKRIGPAEYESAAVEHEGVVECAAVGVPDQVKGTVVWCFCILAPGFVASPDMETDVKRSVAAELGKAFAPAEVRFVDELPKTRSAKILRRAIRARILDEDPGDLSSLENPSALAALDRAMA